MPPRKQKINPIQQTTLDIIDIGKLVFVAIIMIVLLYYVAAAFIGTLPAQISAIIIGLVLVFVYATNQKVRETINDWLKPKNKS
jgi:hypothetical protein